MKYGYHAVIVYDVANDYVSYQQYDKNGMGLWAKPRRVVAGGLPKLLFDLVDEGYTVAVDAREGTIRRVAAVSPQWHEDMKTKVEVKRVKP